jgi:hypothetical protein
MAMTAADEPPFINDGAAPHFYKRRPVHLCADGRDDDDDGPPNWGDRDAE